MTETERLVETVIEHTGLVKSIANKYVGRGLSFDDLEQYGWLGFMKAYHKYDEKKGAKLSTYAYVWVESEILNALNHNKNIHIPVYRQRQYRTIKRHIKGNVINFKALEALGFTEDYVKEVINDPRTYIALDKQVGEETTMLEYVKGDLKTPEEITNDELREQALINIIEPELTPYQFETLMWLYGFNTGSPMTHKEVGEIMGVTGESVRRTKERALERLKTKEIMKKVRDL